MNFILRIFLKEIEIFIIYSPTKKRETNIFETEGI